MEKLYYYRLDVMVSKMELFANLVYLTAGDSRLTNILTITIFNIVCSAPENLYESLSTIIRNWSQFQSVKSLFKYQG